MDSGNCLALSLNTLNSMFFSFSAKRGTGNNFLLTLTGPARSWEVLSGCHEEFSKVLEPRSSGVQQFTCNHAVHELTLQGPATHVFPGSHLTADFSVTSSETLSHPVSGFKENLLQRTSCRFKNGGCLPSFL